MKRYRWILFDADETLFEFDAPKGLRLMFDRFEQVLTDEELAAYQKLNHQLWQDYQAGLVTVDHIRLQRFSAWQERLGLPSEQINTEFLSAMAEICSPLPHAKSAVEFVGRFARLGLITNGFKEWQALRLQRTGLSERFEFIITSEDAACAKPDPRIFALALARMGGVLPEEVLMVGDNLHSDIHGGRNAGFDTCWIANRSAADPGGSPPTYTVSSMLEFHDLMQSHYKE